jgi:transcriptional regulator with XRE-family HTH domain
MQDFFSLKLEKATPGQVIKAFRRNFKITLKELGEITGISQTNLSAIENDRVDIGVRRAVLIAAALGVEPSVILFPEGFESPYQDEINRVKKAAKQFFKNKPVKEAS